MPGIGPRGRGDSRTKAFVRLSEGYRGGWTDLDCRIGYRLRQAATRTPDNYFWR